jgi:alpha-methylacyl-CoA racemase
MAAMFRTRTRDEWTALLEGEDACAAPVLTMAEAPAHPHLAARGAFVVRDGVTQSAPAPRFAGTPTEAAASAVAAGVDEVLAGWT